MHKYLVEVVLFVGGDLGRGLGLGLGHWHLPVVPQISQPVVEQVVQLSDPVGDIVDVQCGLELTQVLQHFVEHHRGWKRLLVDPDVLRQLSPQQEDIFQRKLDVI